jgi:O-methyltransferase
MINIEDLDKLHSMLSRGPTDADRKLNIWQHLKAVAYIPGDIVEIGCFKGQTSVLIRYLMNAYCPNKRFHVYDSFIGLQGNREEIDGTHDLFKDGKFCADQEELDFIFESHSLQLPEIHKTLVKDIKPEDLPNKISFAYLDLDLYEPTIRALELVWPKLNVGSGLVVDDYNYDPCPGINVAVDEFFSDKEVTLRTPHKSALIRKW